MANGDSKPGRPRRIVLQTTGATGLGMLAGCLGDDDPEPDDDADDKDDTPDPGDDTGAVDDSDADDGAPADDTDDGEPDEDVERYDAVATNVRGPPMPGDAQYNQWAGGVEPVPDFVTAAADRYITMGWSFSDQQLYGELVQDWSYEPGFLEITFHDDFYWWRGDVVNATDWTSYFELRNWAMGGDDFDAFPTIITAEATDDYTLRLAMADTWREEWAIQQTMVEYPQREIYSSRVFNEPWIEQFNDTGGDLDAVEDVRQHLDEHRIDTDEELVHHFHIPFEFRLDGDLGEVGEDYWELELVPEKDGVTRHFADDINFTKLRWLVAEEADIRSDEEFLAENQPFAGAVDFIDDGVDFEHTFDNFHRDFDTWSWTFNCEIHPTESPQFRRAWMYMADRSLWEGPASDTPVYASAFLTDERVEAWVSDEIIEAFENFGHDEVMWDEAEDEMVTGGFERNGDGDWIDQDSGEPIEFDVASHAWMGNVSDEGSDFFSDINAFGLRVGHVTDRFYPAEVAAEYHGGLIPEFIFESIFGESDLTWAGRNPNLPESVRAPPLGETNAPPEDWIEYETRTMTDQLGVIVDEDQYQEAVDTLAWVHNQIQPRGHASATVQSIIFNDQRWEVSGSDAAPSRWLRLPFRTIFLNGTLSYVPEDER